MLTLLVDPRDESRLRQALNIAISLRATQNSSSIEILLLRPPEGLLSVFALAIWRFARGSSLPLARHRAILGYCRQLVFTRHAFVRLSQVPDAIFKLAIPIGKLRRHDVNTATRIHPARHAIRDDLPEVELTLGVFLPNRENNEAGNYELNL